MKLIIVFIAILLLAGCANNTHYEYIIKVDGHDNEVDVRLEGLAVEKSTEQRAEQRLTAAQDAGQATAAGAQSGQTSNVKPVDNTKNNSENTSSSATPVPVIAPVTTTKTKVEETEVIGENNSSEVTTTGSKAYHHYFVNGDSKTEFFKGKSIFMTCPSEVNFEGCELIGNSSGEFNYHNIDPDENGNKRFLWLYPGQLPLDKSSTMKCWNEKGTVEFTIGSGGEGIDAIGNSWGVCD